MYYSLYLPDVLGGITLTAGASGLRSIRFGKLSGVSPINLVLEEASRQIREYFDGDRFDFDLPLELEGSEFQLAVWRALLNIPYGQTRSYRDMAVAVNRPKGFQAIGQANTSNPLPIIVPCHRVINADGSMGGYGGGLDRKRALLTLEQRHAHLVRKATA